MASQVRINLLIDAAQSAKTLGELEKSLSEMNEELKELDVNSDAFKELKTQIDATNKSLQGINVSSAEREIKTLEARGKTLTSALGFVTGAMALFGTENEEVVKSLARVQGALAISTAFKDFAEAQKAANESGSSLNKTLLGNPFILIAAVLLPLIAQTGAFKDIMAQLSGVAKELFTAIKPLLDAFMELLNSVLKALMPIIKALADILIKALAPVFKVISSVVKALNPLFQKLGDFLSENTILMDALTLAIQAALLPLTVFQKTMEFFGVIEPIDETKEAVEKLGFSLEDSEVRASELEKRLKGIGETYDIINAENERNIRLAEAQGKTQKEIDDLKLKNLLALQTAEAKRLTELKKELQFQGQLANEELKNRVKLGEQAFLDAKANVDIFKFQLNQASREASKKRIEEIKKTQKELEDSYIKLRGIARENSLRLAKESEAPFVGFFEDLIKVSNDIIGTIPATQLPLYKNLKDLLNDLFLNVDKNGVSAFERFADANKGVSKSVDETIKTIQTALEDLIKGEPSGLDKNFATELQKQLGIQYGIIKNDAKVFALSLENTFEDISKTPGFYANLFNQNLEKIAEGFDFTQAPVLVQFDLFEKDVKERLAKINEALSGGGDAGPLTLVQRQRLEEQKKLLVEFITSYKKEISKIGEEDIVGLLLKPIEKTIPKLFDDLRTGTSEFVIEYEDQIEQFRRLTEFPDEFIGSVRKSLISLGVEADKIDKSIETLLFNARKNVIQSEIALNDATLSRITLGEKERNELLKKNSDLRIRILNEEAKRAIAISGDEVKRFAINGEIKLNKELERLDKEALKLKENRDANLITEEEYQNKLTEIVKLEALARAEFENDVSEKRRKFQVQSQKITDNLLKDIENERRLESFRKLEQFRDFTNELISGIQSLAQSTSDILNNLSTQALINLEAQFNTQVAQLEAAKNAGLKTQREFDFERLKAQEIYEQKRRRLEKQAWERQYASQLGQAIAGTALAVINALAQFPGPPITIPASIAAGVLGAAQIAVIATQPKPKFKKGGLVGGVGSDDMINAMITPGEFIVNKNATSRFLPLLKNINQWERPAIGSRETVASPPPIDIPERGDIRAYVVLDELRQKNDIIDRLNLDNSFFSN